jgi:serine/threonine protein kinase
MIKMDRWARVKRLFQESQQQPDAQRIAWLKDQCIGDDDSLRDVLHLLNAQRAAPGILADGAAALVGILRSDEPFVDHLGQRVGAYRILRLLGEGGMGRVYLAEREDGEFVQRVALKLIRADFMSDAARVRFLRERKILAGFVHPHIAQLHDGGVASDGAPYFTLEYVEGKKITEYCDASGLTIPQRVAMILQVCSAVTYAHRNLIVHRDLKPSNILVTADGDAKLLDFGIAKLVGGDVGEGGTATDARMMTPEYAAPEQVLGDKITTATDVYAIGVLLYELLCGRLPYARADAGSISWAKAVVEEAPENFGQALDRAAGTTKRLTGNAAAATRGTTLPVLRRTLRGDLEHIVQRALAKEPEDRYASVTALADDLTAYIDGRAKTRKR